MFFTSTAFLILLTIIFVANHILPRRNGQIGLLIGASLVFYAWNFPILRLLLIVTVPINWGLTYGILSAEDSTRRKTFAALGVALNLGILAFFKYSHSSGKPASRKLPIHRDGILPENGDLRNLKGYTYWMSYPWFQNLSVIESINQIARNTALPTDTTSEKGSTLFIRYFQGKWPDR